MSVEKDKPRFRQGLIHSRVLDLDRIGAGADYRMPVRAEVFYVDRVYRVRARVQPNLDWRSLLDHLLDAIYAQYGAVVPKERLRYSVLDMKEATVLSPAGRIRDTGSERVVYIHHSEFRRALNRRRRAFLIIDVLRHMPWPLAPPSPDPLPVEESKADGSDSEADPMTADAATPVEEVEQEATEEATGIDVIDAEPVGPELEALPAPGKGAWALWQHDFAPKLDEEEPTSS